MGKLKSPDKMPKDVNPGDLVRLIFEEGELIGYVVSKWKSITGTNIDLDSFNHQGKYPNMRFINEMQNLPYISGNTFCLENVRTRERHENYPNNIAN